jgi:hypothetical protein
MLSFNAALLVTEQQMGTQLAITMVRPIQPRVVVKTASKAEAKYSITSLKSDDLPSLIVNSPTRF